MQSLKGIRRCTYFVQRPPRGQMRGDRAKEVARIKRPRGPIRPPKGPLIQYHNLIGLGASKEEREQPIIRPNEQVPFKPAGNRQTGRANIRVDDNKMHGAIGVEGDDLPQHEGGAHHILWLHLMGYVHNSQRRLHVKHGAFHGRHVRVFQAKISCERNKRRHWQHKR